MKTLYTVVANFMNGSVTLCTDISNYTNKELAEKVKENIIKVNEGSMFPVMCHIEETKIYEFDNEVPILNNKDETKNSRKDT